MRLLALLGGLAFLPQPVLGGFVHGAGGAVEKVGRAAAHLLHKRVSHVAEIERAGLRRDLGVEQDLEQQVGQFGLEIVDRQFVLDCLRDLLSLLPQKRQEAVVRHRLLPFAAAARGVHRAGGLEHRVVEAIDAHRFRAVFLPAQDLRVVRVGGNQPLPWAAFDVEGPADVDRHLRREGDIAADAAGQVEGDQGGPAGVEKQDGCGHGGQV